MRKGIKKVLDLLNCKEKTKEFYECKDVNFILTFPTGYGKTTLSLELAKLLSQGTANNFHRIIHVVPTRSLATDIVCNACRWGLIPAVQYSFSPSEIKSPLFLAKFIVTTYDSFLLNLYKASVGEPFSYHGHYDLPRFGIYTSLVHFDEFHLMKEKNSWTSLIEAVRHLSKMKVNMILSSATPSKNIEEELIRAMEGREVIRLAIVNQYGQSVKNRKCKEIEEGYYECEVGSVKYKNIEVKDEIKEPKININFLDNEDEIMRVVKENREKKIIVIVNTVEKAIELYEKLKDLSPCLIHSRFKMGDRDKKLRRDCKIIISTQVIEVGVNISSEVMISEQAPITSIVQRVGRLLRYNEREEGDLYIWKSGKYYPYDKDEVESTVKELEAMKGNISLKSPYSYGGIVDKIIKKPKVDNELQYRLERIAESIFTDKKDLEKLLEDYCSLTDTYVINVATEMPKSEKDLIPLDGNLAIKIALKNGECFEAYAEEYGSDERTGTDNANLKEICIKIKNPCKDYRRVYEIGGKRYIIYALKVDEKLYDEEEGLKI